MSPQPLSVIVKVKPGEEQALHDVLYDMGHDVMNNPHVHFRRSKLTHFCRFVILPGDLPIETGMEPHLLFSSNYDGDLDTYLSELVHISPGMEEIWGRCVGYSGVETFPSFVRRYHHPPQTFYVAFRDETAESIRTYRSLRNQMQSMLDDDRLASLINTIFMVPQPQGGPLKKVVNVPMRAITDLVETVREASRQAVRRAFFPLNVPHKPYSAIELQLRKSRELLDHVEELAGFEDLVVQNQMNILSMIRPGHAHELRRVFATVTLAALLSPPGTLAGLSTIHFARWIMFDEDRRLLFLSNYDGTWETYIADFVRDVADGMNAIWQHTIDFPEGGPPDLAAFEDHIRTHQIRSLVFYSAYPDLTVKNILNDRALSRLLSSKLNVPGAADVLRHL